MGGLEFGAKDIIGAFECGFEIGIYIMMWFAVIIMSVSLLH